MGFGGGRGGRGGGGTGGTGGRGDGGGTMQCMCCPLVHCGSMHIPQETMLLCNMHVARHLQYLFFIFFKTNESGYN